MEPTVLWRADGHCVATRSSYHGFIRRTRYGVGAPIGGSGPIPGHATPRIVAMALLLVEFNLSARGYSANVQSGLMHNHFAPDIRRDQMRKLLQSFRRSSPDSLAILAAMRRASSLFNFVGAKQTYCRGVLERVAGRRKKCVSRQSCAHLLAQTLLSRCCPLGILVPLPIVSGLLVLLRFPLSPSRNPTSLHQSLRHSPSSASKLVGRTVPP